MRVLRNRPTAFSTIELIVVIAILGLLIGILLPAIQNVRRSAARTVCENNARQLALALHGYHGGMGAFPSGLSGLRSPQPYLSWLARMLPYLEQERIWRETEAAFEADQNFLNNPPHTHLATTVRAFLCPADSRIETPQPLDGTDELRSFTSFVGITGINSATNDGLLYYDSSHRSGDVADGTSNTIIFGERPPSANFVLGWWYAGWGQAQNGDGDMVMGVRANVYSRYGLGCPAGPYQYSPGSVDNQCDAFHYWSLHSGGAYFAFADGSVRFLRYSANDIMPALATRAGGEVVAIPD